MNGEEQILTNFHNILLKSHLVEGQIEEIYEKQFFRLILYRLKSASNFTHKLINWN